LIIPLSVRFWPKVTSGEEIRQQATSQVRALIEDLSGSIDVSDILFSSILVQ